MIIRIGLLLLLTLTLFGCKKPVEHPEAVDPIYQDLQKQQAENLRSYQDKQKEVEKAKKAFEVAPIRTGERQDAQDAYFDLVHAAEKLRQNYRFFSIKAEKRKKYDQTAYAKAFEDNKPWPDQDSYAEYLTDKHLQDAPREWNPENRINARKPATVKPAPAEEGNE